MTSRKDAKTPRIVLLLAVLLCAFAPLRETAAQCGPLGCPLPQQGFSAAVHPAVPRVIHRVGNLTMPASGVLVERRADSAVVLTAAHLFDQGIGAVEVQFSNGQSFQAIVEKIDKPADVAALLIRRPAVEAAPLAEAAPAAGELVSLHGYPGEGYAPGQAPYRIAAGPWRGIGQDGQYEAGMTAAPGFSGGPIVNGRGQICGLCWATRPGTTIGPAFPRLRAVLWAIRPGVIIPKGPAPLVRVGPCPPSDCPLPPQVSLGQQLPAPPIAEHPIGGLPPAAIPVELVELGKQLAGQVSSQAAELATLKAQLEALEKRLATVQTNPGPPGPPGRDGQQGPPGAPGTGPTAEQIAQVLAKMPIKFRKLDAAGAPIGETNVYLGGTVDFKRAEIPIRVLADKQP